MVANITNDISLLRQIREGNEDAFKSLFETYFTPLCRFIYLHLDDKNVAEELAMDIFIYLWENRETFQIQLSLKAYLFQAAKNKCLNELRKKKETVGLDGGERSIPVCLLLKPRNYIV